MMTWEEIVAGMKAIGYGWELNIASQPGSNGYPKMSWKAGECISAIAIRYGGYSGVEDDMVRVNGMPDPKDAFELLYLRCKQKPHPFDEFGLDELIAYCGAHGWPISILPPINQRAWAALVNGKESDDSAGYKSPVYALRAAMKAREQADR